MQNSTSNPARTLFPEGVSGYELSDRDAVIWTCVQPGAGEPRAVLWELYGDNPIQPLRHGLMLATAQNGYRVRIVLTDLPPGRYRFGFEVDGVGSPQGELAVSPQRASIAA